MSLRLHLARRLALAAGLAGVVVTAPFWGNPAWASTSTTQTHHAPHKTIKAGPLSGNWSGSYGGSYSGTFNLTWKELGNKLNGTIKISAFGNAASPLKGTVQGKAITFGTVGSQAITYSGTFSGSSMSGTWKLVAAGHSLGGGSWHATRSS